MESKFTHRNSLVVASVSLSNLELCKRSLGIEERQKGQEDQQLILDHDVNIIVYIFKHFIKSGG